MTTLKTLTLLTALTTLTACDRLVRDDVRAEHDDRLYRAAMDDYRSGRLDAALAGFAKAIKADPANASARFQQACLLQDAKRDFLGACCGYREYLLQEPTSDKAKLAKDRLATCERELAKTLAERYGVGVASAAAKAEADALRAELKETKALLASAEKSLAETQSRARALEGEKSRLLAAVRGDDAEGEAKPADLKDVRALLDDEDEDAAPPSFAASAKELDEKDEDAAPPSFAALAKDAGEDEESMAPPIAVGAKADGKAKDKAKDESKVKAKNARPATYVVEDGDTLYGISKRFYGTMSVWKKIRDANKALISSDNRPRAGDNLVLPEL